MVLSITLFPAKPTMASGSAIIISPSIAKLALTPPVVGLVSRVIYNSPKSLCLLIAALVFAICIRDNIPSCILAPPLVVAISKGSLLSVANSTSLVILSPTTVPIEPIKKWLSIIAAAIFISSINPVPHTTASLSFVLCFAFLSLAPYSSLSNIGVGIGVSIFSNNSSKVFSSKSCLILFSVFNLI